jgi:16S rRNA (adenine1518-N6/adenine1519-N6)-dimethyltransferase
MFYADKLARAAGPLRGSTVIEVGPGPGSLTRSLLTNGARKVIVVEKDKRFESLLPPLPDIVPSRTTCGELQRHLCSGLMACT